jgi:hypothetical protein
MTKSTGWTDHVIPKRILADLCRTEIDSYAAIEGVAWPSMGEKGVI